MRTATHAVDGHPAGHVTGVAAPSYPLAEACAALINDVYAATEDGLWASGHRRTDVETQLELAATGCLVHTTTLDGDLLGVVAVHVDPHTREGNFSMLAVHPRSGGSGVGTTLVRAAEEHARARGARTMTIRVLRPTAGENRAKNLLAVWYPLLGYRLVGSDDVAAFHPEFVPDLIGPAVLDRYVRVLT